MGCEAALRPQVIERVTAQASARVAVLDADAAVAFGLGEPVRPPARFAPCVYRTNWRPRWGVPRRISSHWTSKPTLPETSRPVSAALDARSEFEATLRALTRVAFDGDLQVYVPERGKGGHPEGEVDLALWEIHKSMVEEAQQSRARFLATMAELAARLLDVLRIGS